MALFLVQLTEGGVVTNSAVCAEIHIQSAAYFTSHEPRLVIYRDHADGGGVEVSYVK